MRFTRRPGNEPRPLNVFSSPFLASLFPPTIARAAESRLPAIYQWKEHAEAGGLVSYGPSLAGMWRQVAHVVGKILGGATRRRARGAATKFELVIDLKTARTLGLTIPRHCCCGRIRQSSRE